MQKKLYACFSLMLLFSMNLFAASPTTPTTNIIFSSVDGGSVHLNWTNGNGSRRIVIARQLTPVTAVPVNGIDYLHDDDFGLGQEIVPGEFVVYDGSGTNTDVRNLQPATLYHFAIYEYNGSGSTTEYIGLAPSAAFSTLSAPTAQASAVSFSNITGNTIRINWTNGNGSKRLVLARAGSAVNANPSDLTSYSASATFGSGAQIGSGNYVVHSGSANNVTVTGLQPNTTYHFLVFESNGTSQPVYYTVNPPAGSQSTLPAPSVAASNLVFSQVDGNVMRVEWTRGNGSRRIVVARAGSPVDAVPVNGIDYLPGNTIIVPFDTAPELAPGQKVVLDNISDFTNLTGLSPNTVYHFAVFEYDGTGTAISYLTSSFGSGSQSTSIAPTNPASSIVFSNVSGNAMKLTWTNGNGARRIVVAKAGAPVDAVPTDLTSYSGQAAFGVGTQIGSGNYVVYAATGNTVTVTGLSLNETYHFAVFEANGINAPVYNTISPAVASQATTDRPTIAASAITYSELEGNKMKLGWVSGNGQRRIIIVSENAPVTAVPVDGVDYLPTATASFATAPEIAPGQKVVFDNTSSLSTITGLTKGNTYHFRIYEYSGTGSTIAYLTTAFATGSQATLTAPANAASNPVFTNVTGNSITLNWTNGNGARRIVLVKAGAPVDAVPADYTSYGSSATFGSGNQIGSGNYVIASSSTSSATVNNLQLNTTYHFAIFEYNGSEGPVYLTSSFAVASQTTADRPTVAAGNMSFSAIDGDEMRVGWASGNGQRRIVVARAGSPVDAAPADGVDYLAAATASFATAPEIAPGQKVIYDNAGSFTDLTGLQPNTTYYFRVYEYSATGTAIAYLTTAFASGNAKTLSNPTIQATGVAFTSVTSTSVIVSWTAGNGSSRMVVAKKSSAVDATPVDLTEYLNNPSFGNGTQIGSGNYVVAKTTGTSFTMTNLTPGTTYHIAVFEYNGSGGPLYLAPPATGNTTTIGPPATQSSAAFINQVNTNSVQLNWTNGSGNKRIVIMKQGAPVDALPVNNAAYFANSFFGSGTEIGTGNFVVFNGIQDFVTITNLASGTLYHFAVFEYNDFGSSSQYLLTAPATGSAVTGILPVTYVDFKGSTTEGRVRLQWATATEQSSAYFDIERSSNGNDYQRIGSVTAAGNSNGRRDYSFDDQSPLTGAAYYRLKQVDVDGKAAYSKVIRISSGYAKLVKRFVNPITDKIIIEMDGATKPTSVMVYDMSGRIVLRTQSNATLIQLDAAALIKGIYVVGISNNGKTEKIKIVKQ